MTPEVLADTPQTDGDDLDELVGGVLCVLAAEKKAALAKGEPWPPLILPLF